jgi:hypothetical protein
MHVRGRRTAPADHCSSPGRSCTARGTTATPSAVAGRIGFYDGHLKWGGAFPSGAAAGSGACIARQSVRFAPALPCYACHTCLVRQGLAGSAPLSSYACPAHRDAFPGRPHPPSGAAVKTPDAAGPPRGTAAPSSGARRYPPDAATSPRDDRALFKCPPLRPRTLMDRPGGPPHPSAVVRPRPCRAGPDAITPPGTDAWRNRPHGCRAPARPRKPLVAPARILRTEARVRVRGLGQRAGEEERP